MLRNPTAAELVTLKKWRLSTFFVMLFGYVGYYLCRQNLSAAFPLLEAEFGYTNAQLGLIAAYSEIAYAAGKFINGPMGDRIGGRKIFLIGMLGTIFFNIAFSMMGSLAWFIIIWCICRYFLSMGWGGLAKTIGSWYEPERNGTIMGFISLNFQFGGVVATLLAGLIVSQGGTWQQVFIIPAGMLALIFIWSFFASKDSPQKVFKDVRFPITEKSEVAALHVQSDNEEDDTVNPMEVIKGLLKLKVFQVLLVYSFLTTALRSIFFFWTPKLLADLGMGAGSAIIKSAVFPAAGCIGTILLGWYTDKHAKNGDRAKMMWIMLTALTLCLGLVALSMNAKPDLFLIVLLLGFCGFFLLGPYSMSSGCLTLDIAGSRGAGSCTGLIDGVGYLGGAFSVWLAGQLSDKFGWQSVFFLLIAYSIFSVLAAFIMSLAFQKRFKETQK